MLRVLKVGVAMCLVMIGTVVFANQKNAEADITPHKVVEGVTKDLLRVIKDNAQIAKEDPQKYFDNVAAVLEPSVAFEYIARNVMTKPNWLAATEAQQALFVDTFKRSMVETLAKGMATYSDLNIKVLPPKEDITDSKRVEVLQEVETKDGKTALSYTMAQGRSGEWKLINVVLNGVNLGKSFRDQFLQAHKKHAGNIDLVIQNWGKEA